MSAFEVSRRRVLEAIGACAFASATDVASAVAQPAVRFRDIRVDVSPLRANVGDPTAAWVQKVLPGYLAQALAPYMSPGDRSGATLTVRIDNVYLGPSAAGGAEPGGSWPDTMKGILIVTGPRGGIAEETPLRATSFYYPSPVDQALVEQAYYYRVVDLAQAFAGWVPKQLGL
jgi:hypothetical protein